MKTVAIVQARMGSTRLPGKTLLPLAGKALLWHVIERVKRAKNLNGIVLATSTNPLDDAIENFAKENNTPYVRGPEQDVLERFIIAGDFAGAEGVLRVNADSPLIEPTEIDRVIKAAKDGQWEAAYVDVSTPTAIAGFEFATLDVLKKTKKATGDPYAHEHVTVYLRTEPNFAKHIFIKPDQKFNIEDYQPAIDIQADYEFFTKIYDKFYKDGEIIDLAEVVNYLKQNL